MTYGDLLGCGIINHAMLDHKPRIASLQPIVLADNRRVTLEMVVDNLPTITPNVFFAMPDLTDATAPPPSNLNDTSTHPNIELSILNGRRQVVVSLFIVEHKEEHTALTLHLPAPNPQESYIARAEVTYQNQTLDVVEVPFTLHQKDAP